MSIKRWDVAALGGLGIAALATVAVYDQLPDPIPTHFDLHGQPNGWMSRAAGAWFAPVFGLAIWAFVRFMPNILPASEKRRLAGDVSAIVAALTALFLVAIHVVILRRAMDPLVSINATVFVLGGLFFAALGLVLPRVKRNALIGIRTPWALASDENWARTQRVGGYAMVVSGVLTAIVGARGDAVSSAVAIAIMLAGPLVASVYSLLLARRQDQG
jgi:uncharacterized membrane protein